MGKKKEKYNFYWNKYLEDIGLKRETSDITKYSKSKRLKKRKKKTGIDYRECYNLDISIAAYIYSRLKAYRKHTISDLESKEDDFGDYHGTLKGAIDIVLKGLKLTLQPEGWGSSQNKYLKKCQKYLNLTKTDDKFKCQAQSLVYKKALTMLSEIAPYLWN